MKQCVFCHGEFPLDRFYLTRRGTYSSRCKECHGQRFRPCAVCGAMFIGRPNRKLCSERCRKLWRPRAILNCDHCGTEFHPDHLARRFCSAACKNSAQRLSPEERKPRLVATPEARRAQGLVRYYIAIGRLTRPDRCLQCGQPGRVEAAHEDYAQPLLVRWLCRSCHVRWDKYEPKSGCLPRGGSVAA